ncbi:MAG: endonuclease/exonuclease/phosphatase family protein [Planctomycetes bacterium]|nr:endonuclease/exonuclease/phosphatase family protein [Planctomycetota bacterium]
MTKAFTLASWNVEHFKDDPTRVDRVVNFLKLQDPDVFGLYEVEGKEVFTVLTTKMPTYSFHITEGPETQEILVGVRNTLTSFVTQKIEFRSGTTHMRPGALLTLTIAGKNYTVLFLHVASGNDPRGMGLRDDMLVRACDFRKVLDKADKAAGGAGRANYLFVGDLNTMGMRYPFNKSIGADVELQKLAKEAKRVKMHSLSKDAPATWSNGSQSSIPPSNLDHVVAADHLAFKAFGTASVNVRGWPKEPTVAKQDKWIADFSDHGLLFLEVRRV